MKSLDIEELKKDLENIGFQIVPNHKVHKATNLIMTEEEFSKLSNLLTQREVEADSILCNNCGHINEYCSLCSARFEKLQQEMEKV
jgi:hypothetical protein